MAGARSRRPSHCRRRAQPAIAAGRRRRWMTRAPSTPSGSIIAAWPQTKPRLMPATRAITTAWPWRRSRRSITARREPARSGELFKGVCYCCKTAMVAAPGGVLYAAWRHVFEGNLRDIAFTSSRDGGKHVRADDRACTRTAGRSMAVPTMDRRWRWTRPARCTWCGRRCSTAPTARCCMPRPRPARRSGSPLRVPTLGSPKPSHPQIAIDGAGRPVIAWDEVRDGVRRAAVWQGEHRP